MEQKQDEKKLVAMQRKSPKVMHLVLYNPDPKYRPMYFHTREWYKQFSENIDTWYYSYSPEVSEPTFDSENMTLLLPGNESYIPGILNKTIDALRVVTAQGFTVLVRSNISTVVNFPILMKAIEQRGKDAKCYGGTHIMVSEKVRGHSFPFAQGTCMVFAPRTVKTLLKYASDLNLDIEDDRAIALLLQKHDIHPTKIGNQFMDFNPFQSIDQISAFRNHDLGSEDRRSNISNVRLQVNALFKRYVFLKTPQPVKQVLYFNLDVTSKIIEMCKNVAEWKTNQNNIDLDRLFGDPSPNLPKNLMVYFEDPKASILTQRCKLCFVWQNNTLIVQ